MLQALEGFKEPIMEKLKQLQGALSSQQHTADAIDGIHAIHGQLLELFSGIRQARCQHVILRALRFSRMDGRFHDVEPSHERTFSWIFNDAGLTPQVTPGNLPAQASFAYWLRPGRGIFHIEGKPGSGKSTLMKFLCDNQRTQELLDEWAGDKQLIFGNFFFWRAGTPMERSLKGLTRALLHVILQQAPELIVSVFPDEAELVNNKEWYHAFNDEIHFNDNQITSRFDTLLRSELTTQSRRFCFFIDGLDEFDEANGQDPRPLMYSSFVKKICDWAASTPGVKI